MKFVIHSKSERGFWSNVTGWVYDIESATRFDAEEVEKYHAPCVITSGNDAEWMVVLYD